MTKIVSLDITTVITFKYDLRQEKFENKTLYIREKTVIVKIRVSVAKIKETFILIDVY